MRVGQVNVWIQKPDGSTQKLTFKDYDAYSQFAVEVFNSKSYYELADELRIYLSQITFGTKFSWLLDISYQFAHQTDTVLNDIPDLYL